MNCPVCADARRTFAPVLWPALVSEWQLSPAEAASVDRQQGCCCAGCGANLRSMALAKAIALHLGLKRPLASIASEGPALRVLEINEAGTLTRHLNGLPGYVFASYPDVDMMKLPYPDAAFDLVVHSDTLEHIRRPDIGLSECRRVLRPGGACIYTVPVVPGRMSRRRDALPLSFHGNPDTTPDDFRVWTEYGADVWTEPMRVGFSSVSLTAIDFPDAVAITALAAD